MAIVLQGKSSNWSYSVYIIFIYRSLAKKGSWVMHLLGSFARPRYANHLYLPVYIAAGRTKAHSTEHFTFQSASSISANYVSIIIISHTNNIIEFAV
jgi:hypothetical protein